MNKFTLTKAHMAMHQGCIIEYDRIINSILAGELMHNDFKPIDAHKKGENNINKLYDDVMLCLLYNAKDKIQKAIDSISPK